MVGIQCCDKYTKKPKLCKTTKAIGKTIAFVVFKVLSFGEDLGEAISSQYPRYRLLSLKYFLLRRYNAHRLSRLLKHQFYCWR
jgi:hypothetical protein